MKTYASHVMGNADDLERLVAWKLVNPTVEYINKLNCVLQAAEEQ